MELKDIINRIGYFRNKANLSARELSRRLGNDESYITRLENKHFNITITKLLDILSECNVNTEEFFSENYSSYKEINLLNEKIKMLDQNDIKLLNLFIDRMLSK